MPLIIFDITIVTKNPIVETLYKPKSHPSFTCLIISISGSKSWKSSGSKTAIGEGLGMCLHAQQELQQSKSPSSATCHPLRHAEWCHMLSIFLFTTVTSLENKAPQLLGSMGRAQVLNW